LCLDQNFGFLFISDKTEIDDIFTLLLTQQGIQLASLGPGRETRQFAFQFRPLPHLHLALVSRRQRHSCSSLVAPAGNSSILLLETTSDFFF
jgi:hypothetical protein